jgi:hypothetical protein
MTSRPWRILCLHDLDHGASSVGGTYASREAAEKALPGVQQRFIDAIGEFRASQYTYEIKNGCDRFPHSQSDSHGASRARLAKNNWRAASS